MSFRPSTRPPVQDMPPPGGFPAVSKKKKTRYVASRATTDFSCYCAVSRSSVLRPFSILIRNNLKQILTHIYNYVLFVLVFRSTSLERHVHED